MVPDNFYRCSATGGSVLAHAFHEIWLELNSPHGAERNFLPPLFPPSGRNVDRKKKESADPH